MTRPRLSIAGLSDIDALNHIGIIVDSAEDHRDADMAEAALGLADKLEGQGLQPKGVVLLDYFRANAWACLYVLRRRTREEVWSFSQPELEMQIRLLRKAVNSAVFESIDPLYQCQILTNLANQLNTVGRLIEAQALWTRALTIDEDFWMARGNRGLGRRNYGQALVGFGDAAVFLAHAHRDLGRAAFDAQRLPQLGGSSLSEQFMAHAMEIGAVCKVGQVWESYTGEGWPMGRSKVEREYRQWCLQRELFLNPLNDLGPHSIAAVDAMHLPDFAAVLGEAPIIAGMFSELKQVFASARWLLWEGVVTEKPHFSDRGVDLYNTLDYAVFGLATEKIKVAFRMAYSLFDKVAYFLNFYLRLQIPETRVNFDSIWKRNGDALRAQDVASENWPLRGLYWLSRDLSDPKLKESPEPDAREVNTLRNHIEHKYVKVMEDWGLPTQPGDLFHDTLAHTLTRSTLEVRAVRLMQLARSALIYLALAVNQNERARHSQTTGVVGALPLTMLPTQRKR